MQSEQKREWRVVWAGFRGGSAIVPGRAEAENLRDMCSASAYVQSRFVTDWVDAP
jgi:hypothetical protein